MAWKWLSFMVQVLEFTLIVYITIYYLAQKYL